MFTIPENQRFVAHIDILGMSALVTKDPELAWDILSRLVEARNEAHATEINFIDTAEKVDTLKLIQAVTFSDTVVLFTQGTHVNELRTILIMATQLLSKALHLCVPIRIGIAVGTFFFNLDESMYAGPALIEAYILGEKAQWIGITTSAEVHRRASEAKLLSGSSNIVTPTNVPIDGGTYSGYAVNWPVVLRSSIAVPLPVSASQIYSGFDKYFGKWESLDARAKIKYENTADFMNQMGSTSTTT